jgi:hypothetical protein
MDADEANRDRSRVTIPEMWRALSWWERVVCTLAALLFLLAILVGEVSDHLSVSSVGWDLVLRLGDISALLLMASVPFGGATFVLLTRRWRPGEWSQVWSRFQRLWQLWSVRALVVGASVLVALCVGYSVIDLVIPPGQMLPNPPPLPFIAAAALVLGGTLLTLPEIIVRKTRANRQV